MEHILENKLKIGEFYYIHKDEPFQIISITKSKINIQFCGYNVVSTINKSPNNVFCFKHLPHMNTDLYKVLTGDKNDQETT